MPNSCTRRFWVDHLKRNTLIDAINEHPADARRFLGELAFDPARSADLAMVAYAHLLLSLSDRELLSEVRFGEPSGDLSRSRREDALQGNFRAYEQVLET